MLCFGIHKAVASVPFYSEVSCLAPSLRVKLVLIKFMTKQLNSNSFIRQPLI